MHANYIKKMNAELGKEPEMYVGDPSMSQRNAITGTSVLDEYRKLGIHVIPGKKNVPVGLDKMNEYLRQNRWFITKDCPQLIKAMRKYAWKTHISVKTQDRVNPPDGPQKKDDHAPDSCRYYASFLPSLTPNGPPIPLRNPLQATGRSLTVTNPTDFPWRVDPVLMTTSPRYDLGFGEIE
jgi:hypothetical protein